MTFRSLPSDGMIQRLTEDEALVSRVGKKFRLRTFEVFSDGGSLEYSPHLFDSLVDAIGHAELYCGLLSRHDPDKRPMFIKTPTFGKEAMEAMGRR